MLGSRSCAADFRRRLSSQMLERSPDRWQISRDSAPAIARPDVFDLPPPNRGRVDRTPPATYLFRNSLGRILPTRRRAVRWFAASADRASEAGRIRGRIMIQGSLLLVDDDRHVLESMTDWLRSQGLQVDAGPRRRRSRRPARPQGVRPAAGRRAAAGRRRPRPARAGPPQLPAEPGDPDHRLRRRRRGRRSPAGRRPRLPHQAAHRRRAADGHRAGLHPAAGHRRKHAASHASSTSAPASTTSSATTRRCGACST